MPEPTRMPAVLSVNMAGLYREISGAIEMFIDAELAHDTWQLCEAAHPIMPKRHIPACGAVEAGTQPLAR